MPAMQIEFAGQTVSLDYPDIAGETVDMLFGSHAVTGQAARFCISISRSGDDAFMLHSPMTGPSPVLTRADIPEFAMDAVLRGLVTDQSDGVVLHAAAVARGEKSILIAGISGAGKSTLTAWMMRNGFRYLTDELVFLPSGEPLLMTPFRRPLTPFRRPLTLRADSLMALEADGIIDTSRPRLAHGNKAVFPVPKDATKAPVRPGAIIFPAFAHDAELSIEALSASQAALHLLENNLNGANLPDGGLAAVARLTAAAPAFRLAYGGFDQLEDVLEHVVGEILDRDTDIKTWHRIHSAFGRQRAGRTADTARAEHKVQPPAKINERTPPRGKFKLTVGMATYDDFDGVYFTVQSLRLNNPELMADTEILVIDNHPDGPCGDALKELERKSPNYRYIPFAGQSGTAIRDLVFSEASGDYVLCMDCHVLLAPGVLERLFAFLNENPDSKDLYQGPMLYDSLEQLATHFEPEWQQGMYGRWGTDERAEDPDAEPFDIPMQGLGLFVCHREAWPGFNPKFRGFGGEEGYIHEKIRQRGGRTLCLPFLRWLHRFPRPMGIPYKPNWDDRVRNYMIGFRELGLDETPIADHFRDLLGEGPIERILGSIATELENPFNRLEALHMINLDDRADRRQTMSSRFAALGIDRLVKRFPAIATPDNHHIGCALSHRALIADAYRRKLGSVLVFEDDAIFHRDTLTILPAVLDDIANTEWDVLFLGGQCRGEKTPFLPNSEVLREAGGLTASPAIVYNHTIFERILDDVPDEYGAMERWLSTQYGIDQYLARLDIKKWRTDPILAMQAEFFGGENQSEREAYGR